MSTLSKEPAKSNLECLIRVVLLKDDIGVLQAIVPESHLLDLKNLYKAIGRELSPLSQVNVDKLLANNKLSVLENFAGIYDLPTIIDDDVNSCGFCLHEHGEDGDIDESADADEKTAASLQNIVLDELKSHLIDLENQVSNLKFTIPPESMITRLPDPSGDLDQIFNSVKSFTTLRIKQRLEETLEIPTLPQTAQRIIQLRVNPDAMTSELADIVEGDASLAAQVVSWAASPYYAAPGKINSVQDAIVRVLGFDLVSNLALGLALGKSLSLPKDNAAGITPYWLQSVYCSTVVESIVRIIPMKSRPSQGLAYLAGLLHNFGYLVLAHIFPPHFSLICRYMEANPNISHVAIEHHLIQVTREQMSAWLMQLWNMPEEVSTALRHQHDPSYDGEHCEYPNLIFLALRLMRQHGVGDAPADEIPASIYEKFDLDPKEVEEIISNIITSSDDIKTIAANFSS